VVIVFAKAPRAGSVKTRLIPALGQKGAADLYERLVRHLLKRLAPRFELELHTDIPTDAWSDVPVTRELQVEGDLGMRMEHALRGALEEGRPRASIVGGDAPTVPLEYVEALLRSPAEISLGPAEDGGYWGVSAGKVAEGMFAGVDWSTPRAFEQTVQACRRSGLSVEVGPRWRDVDTAEDLEWLQRESPFIFGV
jgi:uncharacterized protein